MKQLDLFSFELDLKIYEVICKANDYDPTLEVAAVFIYPPEMSGASPSFAVKENGKYRLYQISHGHVLFRNGPLDIQNELPNKHWIEL